MIGFYFDEFEDAQLRCEHETCPYKACIFHRYSLDEFERYDYCCEYPNVSKMLPDDIDQMEKCNMYLDE